MLSVKKCKSILGRAGQTMTNSEIESLRDIFVVISDFAIDSFLNNRKFTSDEQKYGNGVSES